MCYTACHASAGKDAGTAGVIVLWNTTEVRRVEEEGEETEVVPGRVVRVKLELVRDQQRLAVYACYMPLREGDEGEATECWEALEDRLVSEEEAKVAVGGDLNAETEEWRWRRGRGPSKWADRKLDEIMQTVGLTAQAKTSTWRGQTQIDNWLVSEEMAGRMGGTMIVPGVSGNDHSAVISSYICCGNACLPNN